MLLLPFDLSAQKESKSTEQFLEEIDLKIPQVLHDFNVPGAAIAIIENGEIVLQKDYYCLLGLPPVVGQVRPGKNYCAVR